MDEDAQKNILSAIILPKTYTWPEWVRPSCHSLGVKVDWSKEPFEIIKAAYKAAYDVRTDINRDVKNFKMPEGDTSEAEQYEPRAAKLELRKKELQDARDWKSRVEGAATGRTKLVEAAKQRKAEAEGRLAREQQSLAGIEARILSKDATKKAVESAKGAKKAAELDAEMATLTAQIEAKKAQIKALEKLGKECPTCHTELTEKAIAAIAKPMISERDDLDDKYRAAVDSRKKLGNPAEAAKQVEDHERATTELKRAQERIQAEQTAIKDAEAKLEELSGLKDSEDSTANDTLIVDLETRVAKGTEFVAAARSAKELLARKEAAKAEQSKLFEKQKEIEKLVVYFDSDGVKAELLADSIGPFVDGMNKVLSGWGYTCNLNMEPYTFSIMFMGENGMPHPVSLKFLSKSQRYRFGVAFQVALAVFSGFRFVVVDEADIYDKAGKAGLLEAVKTGGIAQAIVLATNDDRKVPKWENAAFYMLENSSAPGMIPTTTVERLDV